MAAMAASIACSSKLVLPSLSPQLRRPDRAVTRHLQFTSPRASVSSPSTTTSSSSHFFTPNLGSDALWTPPMASQAAPMQSRSAEADVMGLLLRQRIVFLGHQMDDFVADAIVSQLLLLDAVDPTKEIRLFVNCPGGSIRCADESYGN